MELPDPPEGWTIKSLNEIDEGSWSAYLLGPEAYVYGYGTTMRYALLDAYKRIEECDYFERLSGGKKATQDISALIDLVKQGVVKGITPAPQPDLPKPKRRW